MQQMLFCNSPPGRNLQRAGVARNTKAFLLFQRFATVGHLCASSLCRTNGESREEKPAVACHIYFPVPHTAAVIAQHRDSYHTANHNNILGEQWKREKNLEAEWDINTIRVSHCWNTWGESDWESNEEQERGSTAGELVRSILIVFPGLLEPCSSRLFV